VTNTYRFDEKTGVRKRRHKCECGKVFYSFESLEIGERHPRPSKTVRASLAEIKGQIDRLENSLSMEEAVEKTK
jgi:transcriptional regulator NrdR family protein